MSHHGMRRLFGKSALVTGSTYGMGFAIAKRLAEEGAKVIISSRKKKNVEEATEKLQAQGFNVTGVTCHVSNAEDRKRLFEEASKNKGLDVLVCNAGVNPVVAPLFDCSDAVWDKTFDVNLRASYLLTREALPLLKQSKAGRVIYNSSYAAFSENGNLGFYGISKTALCALTKNAAIALGPDNITVNCIAPGMIKTRFSQILVSNEVEKEKLLSRIPLGRFGETEDISGVVAFLASDDAAFITGENIIVSGGMHSRL